MPCPSGGSMQNRHSHKLWRSRTAAGCTQFCSKTCLAMLAESVAGCCDEMWHALCAGFHPPCACDCFKFATRSPVSQAVLSFVIVCPAGKKDCEGSWSAFGFCNVTCGTGAKFRTYTITKQAKNGGQQCEAADGAVGETTCQGTDPAFDPEDCTKCSPGYGGPSCTSCPAGEWSAGGTTECIPCGLNSTTAGNGTTSSSGCSE
jgi:hypothetical protein